MTMTAEARAPKLAAPFLKWAGGKRQLAPRILDFLPRNIATYYEPFVGGGAVFFALANEGRFAKAFLNDSNTELTNIYEVVRDSPTGLMWAVDHMPVNEAFFKQIRAWDLAEHSRVERAARFLYLNKTVFNGLYRVNKSGQFNTPWGKYEYPSMYDEEKLLAASRALLRAFVFNTDFELALTAGEGDAVYFDPPYVPVSKTANFASYTRDGFTLKDQERLARCFTSLVERGVFTLASNADLPVVREMYAGWEIHEVSARRAINSKGDKRGKVGELLIVGRRS